MKAGSQAEETAFNNAPRKGGPGNLPGKSFLLIVEEFKSKLHVSDVKEGTTTKLNYLESLRPVTH